MPRPHRRVETADEHVSERPESLGQQARDQNRFRAEPVAEDAEESKAPAHAGQALETVDRHRGERATPHAMA